VCAEDGVDELDFVEWSEVGKDECCGVRSCYEKSSSAVDSVT